MSNKQRYASAVKRLSKINLLCKEKSSRITSKNQKGCNFTGMLTNLFLEGKLHPGKKRTLNTRTPATVIDVVFFSLRLNLCVCKVGHFSIFSVIIEAAIRTMFCVKATFHLTISMRGQRATGKIQRNNYHHGICGPSLTGKTMSVLLIFTQGTHRNVKNR